MLQSNALLLPAEKLLTISRISRRIMQITKNTRVSAILEEYGDIADVMEIFGVKRVARYSFRKMLTKALTVEVAAKVHRVPLDEFLNILNNAVATHQAEKSN